MLKPEKALGQSGERKIQMWKPPYPKLGACKEFVIVESILIFAGNLEQERKLSFGKITSFQTSQPLGIEPLNP